MAAVWMAAAMTAFLNGTSWVGPADAPLKITFEEGRAHGALSCNNFQTSYEEGDMTLAFGGIATTRKGCSPQLMQKERLVLKFLDAAASFAMDGEVLVLKDNKGQEILRLQRKA
jgi:heat shock protein HslJ